MHLKERMHGLEEKNGLTAELETTRKMLEDSSQEKVRGGGVVADNPCSSSPVVLVSAERWYPCHIQVITTGDAIKVLTLKVKNPQVP